ncbi:cytochrome c [Pseudomonas tohonis]|uniref:Cytochrome c n=1 Tax=Pseudomonas tohonis TaxID=2725477 RepID=A0A6J4E999_9PSED|nr:virulence protein RhuM/Fic/DOC family protein [Pseudomonas tohonis]BCG25544.1 cytochrome c [Pseudomonas tohonis]GJN54449.1 cytochrome c [Pseudomonas tohonis]
MNALQESLPILIYQREGESVTEVRMEGETVWLTQRQMAELFDKNVRTISEHIRNIFREGELSESAAIRDFRITAADGKFYDTSHYSLDVIISVGYRVKSAQGTRFRIWANGVLKEHLLQGYSLNRRRLEAQQARIGQLQKTLTLFRDGLVDRASLTEARGLVSVIAGYARTFVLLNQFDGERLARDGFTEDIRYVIEPGEAAECIAALKADLMHRGEASELFGQPKDDSFEGLLGNIVQSLGGQFLYPSIEEQAANLLYMVIKNHPFTDGNKRIGAFLFIWFLRRNRHHLKTDGELKINDNALAAIALLVAQSDPRQKELMVHLVMNLIMG